MSGESDNIAPLVLVVEDEILVGDLVESYLEDVGFLTLRAANATDAIDALINHSDVSLVFSDVVMPGIMDGFGLARWIHAHRPEIPVLLTSGYSRCERLGPELEAVPLLPKPYSLDELRKRLVGLLVWPQLME